MKNSLITVAKMFIAGLLFSLSSINSYAQKLPGVQQSSIFAPADAKADGLVTEWGGRLQAYNKATAIAYTIANDSANLYLIIQATDPHIIEKIVKGGITFSISDIDKKRKTVPVSITYPLLSAKYSAAVVNRIKNASTDMAAEVAVINQLMVNNAKEIKTVGVEAIPDTLISVYNDLGLKVVAALDMKRTYTYELMFQLKYAKALINNAGKFSYNIKLNSSKFSGFEGTPIMGDDGSVLSVSISPTVAADFQNLSNPTDFSGTYTLAKP